MRLSTFILLIAMTLIMAGCASTEHRDTVRTESKRVTGTVASPAGGTVAVDYIETNQAQETSNAQGTSGPDMKQIAPIIGVVATGGSWLATGGLAGLATIATTAIGYAMQQRGGAVAAKEETERQRKDADEAWNKVEAHALARTPPPAIATA